MRRVALLIGSNIDPERNVPLALRALESLGTVRARSAAYRSAPAGGARGPDFWNLAAILETGLEAGALRAAVREVEASLGRVRPAPALAPRTIDIDIVGADGVLTSPEVRLWAYAAVPLAEVVPEWVDDAQREPTVRIAERLRAGTRIERLAGAGPLSERRPAP